MAENLESYTTTVVGVITVVLVHKLPQVRIPMIEEAVLVTEATEDLGTVVTVEPVEAAGMVDPVRVLTVRMMMIKVEVVVLVMY